MIDQILWWVLPESLYRKLRDHCEICGGTRGGVRGNENVVQSGAERVVMCDYCSVDEGRQPGFWKLEPRCALRDLAAATALLEDTKSRFGCDINWIYRRDAFLGSQSDRGGEHG